MFEFRGKSGVDHEIFKYYDDSGDRHFIDSGDVNEYLQQITEQDFTAKDFRTWARTLLTAIELNDLGEFDSEKQASKNITQAIKNTAQQLGNRPATCRNYYVHPAIIEAYQNGSLLDLMSQTTDSKFPELNAEEIAILEIIQQAIPDL